SLRTALEYAVYRTLQRPARWTGAEPAPAEQEQIVGEISGDLSRRLVRLIDRIITEYPRPEWRRAFLEHGKGSTFRRAHILIEDIYEEAVPRPLSAHPYDNAFSRAVLDAFEQVAAQREFILE
ncbi:hypothetical protein ACFQ07_05540, partial [Actinomadura adrarensis]